MSESERVVLAIVVVNYKTPEFVTDCMSTLLPELENLKAKVVIVDNNSGDDSSTVIKNWLAEHDKAGVVLFVQSHFNGGFAAGNNIGIKAIRADYYLMLNSDTLVRKGSIQRLLDTALAHPEAGIISPRLEWPDERGQESCFVYPSPFSELMLAAQTGAIDRILGKYIVAMPLQSQLAYPDWTSFACALVPAEVFQQLGLLDEGYFMYFEDTEFCHRVKKAGWQIIHNPEARVVHLRGGSSPVKQRTLQKKRLPSYYYESRTRLFFQISGYWGLIAANLMWHLGRILSLGRQALGRQDKAAVEKQWRDIWTNCSRPLGQYTHPES